MSADATEAFSNELTRLVERYRLEWNLTYGECIGVLEIMKHELLEEAYHADEEDDDDIEEQAP